MSRTAEEAANALVLEGVRDVPAAVEVVAGGDRVRYGDAGDAGGYRRGDAALSILEGDGGLRSDAQSS